MALISILMIECVIPSVSKLVTLLVLFQLIQGKTLVTEGKTLMTKGKTVVTRGKNERMIGWVKLPAGPRGTFNQEKTLEPTVIVKLQTLRMLVCSCALIFPVLRLWDDVFVILKSDKICLLEMWCLIFSKLFNFPDFCEISPGNQLELWRNVMNH